MRDLRHGRLAPLVALAAAAVIAGLFVVLAGAGNDDNQESARTPLLGRPAPQAIGEFDDGSRFDLSRRKGSWVVLNFFASDCVPCQEEHPELVAFDESGPPGELITVVYGDDRDNVEAFFAERGGGWPVVYDEDGSIATAFGVTLVPETWIIDPNGYVYWRTIAKVTADQLDGVIASAQGAR